MWTRRIQRTLTVREDRLENEFEYRDAEYEFSAEFCRVNGRSDAGDGAVVSGGLSLPSARSMMLGDLASHAEMSWQGPLSGGPVPLPAAEPGPRRGLEGGR